MDKNHYEAYEYLSENANSDGEQFFVVQNDGTFLTVNRPIQLVTQVQDDKEDVDESEPCEDYDVTQQQFYVDVDNPSELISVSDQFVIPDGENNMYSNSYLLQVDNEKDEEMEQDNAEQDKIEFVEENANAENPDNKAVEQCTEITLSDEQYQLLEKNGWILLDIGEKVYLLDNSGLHDITEDKNIIKKLRNEIGINESDMDTEVEPSSSMAVVDTNIPNIKKENEETHNLKSSKSQQKKQNYVLTEEGLLEDNENAVEVCIKQGEPNLFFGETEELNESGHLTSAQTPHDYVRLKTIKDTFVKRNNNALKIKTKLSFKDVPSRIILGKNINGKILIASVKAEKCYKGRNGNTMTNFEQSNVGLDETLFNRLIQEVLWGSQECSLKDVVAAELVVDQLLGVPAFRPTVICQRLIITKVVQEELDESGETYSETPPTLITGRVRKSGLKVKFIHMPTMLQKAAEDEDNDVKSNEYPFADNSFLHIHISEVKSFNGITRISITLNKRPIQLRETNERKQKLVYSCSACAAIYKTEEGLKLHQETECIEIENSLAMDTESINDTDATYTIIKSGKVKQYVCHHCDAVFTKLAPCQKHVKSHVQTDENGEAITATDIKTNQMMTVFKCRMCPSTFLHKATLSQHIMARHIKIEPQ